VLLKVLIDILSCAPILSGYITNGLKFIDVFLIQQFFRQDTLMLQLKEPFAIPLVIPSMALLNIFIVALDTKAPSYMLYLSSSTLLASIMLPRPHRDRIHEAEGERQAEMLILLGSIGVGAGI